MIRYKINVLDELKQKGYSSYKLKKDNIIAGGIITKLQKNDTEITLKTINLLCRLLDCNIDNIIEYVPDRNNDDNNAAD